MATIDISTLTNRQINLLIRCLDKEIYNNETEAAGSFHKTEFIKSVNSDLQTIKKILLTIQTK